MKKILILIIAAFTFYSCSDFLEENPVAELTPDQITVKENLEGLVISAYAVLNGQFDEASNAYNSPTSNWSFGDVCSDDAYKGGGGTGDQNQIHLMEIFKTTPAIKDFERKWLALYEGVKRANMAIRNLKKTDEYEESLKDQRIAEMRFLRGFFYFELKKIYNRIPYVDESAEDIDDYYKSNTELSSDELWGKIEDDLNAAYNVLPMTQAQPGRATKMAAKALLAKAYIFQEKWSMASSAADEVINSGLYQLEPNFSDLYLPENDNGTEIIFSVQNSVNDGSPNNYNGDIGDRLNPPGGPYPQYGFHRPTQNLVNAFKTDENGLPVNDNVNVNENDNVDPRLDYTVARPGIPFLDMGIYQAEWARDLATYGPFSPKKRIVSLNNPLQTKQWPYVSALNTYIIRYADVLLWKAEAAIESGDLETGREYINMIRKRAAESETVKNTSGEDAANYEIGQYDNFANYQEAIEALRLERRLEFAHEGHRFFDLVRWDIAAEVMNEYFEVEKTRRTHLTGASFTKGVHEYSPIPQSQIDLGRGLIQQNPGY